jgi:integrase
MSVRQVRVHGRKAWQARVAYLGRRTSQICENKDAARTAEGELLRALKAQAGADEQETERPATLEEALEGYKANMATRGKGADSIGNVESTLGVLRALLPDLLAKPVGAIGDRDIFAVRNVPRPGRLAYAMVDGRKVARQELAKPSTINRTLQNLRAALKLVRPEYRFPAGAFFQEDESRVRWLRPEEELLVLDGMPAPFREIAQLAALTLMRMTEIRLLRREDVHLEQGVILLPRAKAGARRSF